jgi:PPE-repeat protein
MSTYQAVAGTAAAATPSTDPAPTIQKSDAQTQASSLPTLSGDNPLGLPEWLRQFLQELGIGNSPVAHAPRLDYWFDDVLANYLQQNFGINWSPSAGTVNGASYDSYADPSVLIYYVARSLELFEDAQQFGTDLVQNPVAAFQYLFSWELYDFPLHIEEVGIFLAENPVLLAPLASAAIAPAGVGAVGLAGLAAIPPPTAAPAPVPVAPPVLPAVGVAPTVVASAAAPGTSPGPSPAAATSTVAGPAPPTPPPAAGGGGFLPPYAVGPPGIGTGSGMSAKAKTQEPTSRGAAKALEVAAAAAAASARTKERRRRRAKQRGYGDEFMDMNIDVDPDWGEPVASTVASDQGAGPLGFAGTLSKGSAQAAGLATLSDDAFDRGPSMPMLPGTWDPETPKNGDHR